MMPPRRILLTALATLATGVVSSAAELKTGDPAPALEIVEWVAGDPVTFVEGREREVFVIQFWASSSKLGSSALPRLAAVQRDFADRDVICIAVSSESPASIRDFVGDMKAAPTYRVAADRENETYRAYMEAAGARGLPHALIIDRAGTIAWHGHPLDDMERVLGDVLSGTHRSPDVGRSGAIGRMGEADLLEALSLAFVAEDWDRVLNYLAELIQRDPANRRYIMAKLRVLSVARHDIVAATSFGRAMIEAHGDDPEFLNEMSWQLLTAGEYATRCAELAYEAAEAADRASESKRADITDTLARALYQIGLLDEAIRTQDTAVRLAEEANVEEPAMNEMTGTLRYYRDCAAARDRSDRPAR